MFVRSYNVLADYHQFFLLDDAIQPAYPEVIPEAALKERFQAVPNLVAIYTANSGDVIVSVSVSGTEPQPDLEAWSHVIVCPLAAPSGRIILAGCSDYLLECPRIDVPPGQCGVLICGRGFGEGEREEYALHLWPASTETPRLLKNYCR